MYKYIEVKEISTGRPVKRLDVSNKSERAIERIMGGMLINMNRDLYFLTEASYDTPQN